MPALRQPGDNRLGWAGRLKIARTIGEADHATCVGNIDVARVRPRGPEGDPKRSVEIFREDANFRVSAALRGAENTNSTRPAFGDEEIAARRNPLSDAGCRAPWPGSRPQTLAAFS